MEQNAAHRSEHTHREKLLIIDVFTFYVTISIIFTNQKKTTLFCYFHITNQPVQWEKNNARLVHTLI